MLQWRPFNETIPDLVTVNTNTHMTSPTLQWKHQYQYNSQEEDNDSDESLSSSFSLPSSPISTVQQQQQQQQQVQQQENDLSSFYYFNDQHRNTLPRLYQQNNTSMEYKFKEIPSYHPHYYSQDSYFTTTITHHH